MINWACITGGRKYNTGFWLSNHSSVHLEYETYYRDNIKMLLCIASVFHSTV